MKTCVIHVRQELARELSGIMPGDLRYWRRSISYLAAIAAILAQLNHSGLVGLVSVAEPVRSCTSDVRNNAERHRALLRLLNRQGLHPAQRKYATATSTPKHPELVPREGQIRRTLAEASHAVVLPGVHVNRATDWTAGQVNDETGEVVIPAADHEVGK